MIEVSLFFVELDCGEYPMGRVLRGVTLGFDGRVTASVFFKADLSGLAVIDRSVVGFFSTFVVDASTDRLPREALVGEIDLGEPIADVRLADPFMAVLLLSSVSSEMTSFRFVMELRDGRAFSPGFAAEADVPKVAGRRAWIGEAWREGLLRSLLRPVRWLEAIVMILPKY